MYNLTNPLQHLQIQCGRSKTAFDISADIANTRKDGFCKRSQCFYFLNLNIRYGRAKSLSNCREMLACEIGAMKGHFLRDFM